MVVSRSLCLDRFFTIRAVPQLFDEHDVAPSQSSLADRNVAVGERASNGLQTVKNLRRQNYGVHCFRQQTLSNLQLRSSASFGTSSFKQSRR
jgi:hypothetical protein